MISKVKQCLKSNKTIFELYRKWQALEFKLISLISFISPELNSRIRYKRSFGRKLDLKNPKYFNEKLMWLKLKKYGNNPLVRQCADKYAVREYIENCGIGYILNDLIGAWDRPEDIDWDSLQDRFVIKCNHGAGYNLVCKDKSKFDVNEANKKLKDWMKDEYWIQYSEVQYRGIKKKIICEKYLEGKNDALPVDYKIYCFNGKPLYIGNFIERNMEEKFILRGYFDLDWKPSSVFRYEMDVDKFECPTCLKEMLSYAEILSKPFPFVRVDFYEVNGKVYFGELTFTPTGCIATYYADEAYLQLGEALNVEG